MTSLFSSDVSSVKMFNFESNRLTKNEDEILAVSSNKLTKIKDEYLKVKESVELATITNSDENKSEAERLVALKPYGEAAIAALDSVKKEKNTIMSSTGDVNASIMACNEILMKTINKMKENLELKKQSRFCQV